MCGWVRRGGGGGRRGSSLPRVPNTHAPALYMNTMASGVILRTTNILLHISLCIFLTYALKLASEVSIACFIVDNDSPQ